jgi:nitrogen-specific signal transduction histidine kinase
MLIEQIRIIQRQKNEMAEEAAHIFRNRLTVIGGFAQKLTRYLEDPALREWAGIILKETAKSEKALKRWKKLHREKKRGHEPRYFC